VNGFAIEVIALALNAVKKLELWQKAADFDEVG
jgi:hypothetical protein